MDSEFWYYPNVLPVPIVCEPCKVRCTSVWYSAVSYCKNCREPMCTMCSDVHRSSKATKTHIVVNICDYRSNTRLSQDFELLQKCHYHPEKGIEFFCVETGQFLCSTCILTEETIKKNICDITTAGEKLVVSKYSELIIRDLNNVLEACKKAEAKIIGLKQECHYNRSQLHQQLGQVRSSFLRILEKHEQQILSQVEADQQALMSSLNVQLHTITQMRQQVLGDKNLYETVIQNGSMGDIFRCSYSVITEIEELKQNSAVKVTKQKMHAYRLKISPVLNCLMNDFVHDKSPAIACETITHERETVSFADFNTDQSTFVHNIKQASIEVQTDHFISRADAEGEKCTMSEKVERKENKLSNLTDSSTTTADLQYQIKDIHKSEDEESEDDEDHCNQEHASETLIDNEGDNSITLNKNEDQSTGMNTIDAEKTDSIENVNTLFNTENASSKRLNQNDSSINEQTKNRENVNKNVESMNSDVGCEKGETNDISSPDMNENTSNKGDLFTTRDPANNQSDAYMNDETSNCDDTCVNETTTIDDAGANKKTMNRDDACEKEDTSDHLKLFKNKETANQDDTCISEETFKNKETSNQDNTCMSEETFKNKETTNQDDVCMSEETINLDIGFSNEETTITKNYNDANGNIESENRYNTLTADEGEFCRMKEEMSYSNVEAANFEGITTHNIVFHKNREYPCKDAEHPSEENGSLNIETRMPDDNKCKNLENSNPEKTNEIFNQTNHEANTDENACVKENLTKQDHACNTVNKTFREIPGFENPKSYTPTTELQYCGDILGMAITEDGCLLLTDSNDSKLILLNTDFSFQGSIKLPATPGRVAVSSNKTVFVCLPKTYRIALSQITPELKYIKSCVTPQKAQDITKASCNKLFVSMEENKKWYLCIMSDEGKVLRSIARTREFLDGFNISFVENAKQPFYLQVCRKTKYLYCFDKDGKDVFKYYVSSPEMVCIGKKGIIFVIESTGMLHVISSSGTLIKSMDTSIKNACGFRFNSANDKLIIVSKIGQKVSVFKIHP